MSAMEPHYYYISVQLDCAEFETVVADDETMDLAMMNDYCADVMTTFDEKMSIAFVD